MIVEYGESSCLCCGYLPGGSLIPGQSIGPAPERDDSLTDKESGKALTAGLKALLGGSSKRDGIYREYMSEVNKPKTEGKVQKMHIVPDARPETHTTSERHYPKTTERLPQVFECLATGLGVRETARETGLAINTVRDIIKRQGLPAGQHLTKELKKSGTLASTALSRIEEEPMVTATKVNANIPENIPSQIQTLPPVPARPTGGGRAGGGANRAIAQYYNEHQKELEAEVAKYGTAETLKRWHISHSTWNGLKKRWTGIPRITKKPSAVTKTPVRETKPAVPVTKAAPAETKPAESETPAPKEPDVLAALAIVFGEIAGEFAKIRQQLEDLKTEVIAPQESAFVSDQLKADIVFCVMKAWHPDSAAKKIVEILKVLG
jgi:hypothetical protein